MRGCGFVDDDQLAANSVPHCFIDAIHYDYVLKLDLIETGPFKIPAFTLRTRPQKRKSKDNNAPRASLG